MQQHIVEVVAHGVSGAGFRADGSHRAVHQLVGLQHAIAMHAADGDGAQNGGWVHQAVDAQLARRVGRAARLAKVTGSAVAKAGSSCWLPVLVSSLALMTSPSVYSVRSAACAVA